MVVMRRVVDQALILIAGAEGTTVELADDSHLTYVCAAGNLAGHVGMRLRLDQSLSGLAVRRGETLWCEDAATDDRVDAAACRRVGAVSMVCVPLRRGTEAIGVLKVSASKPRAFRDSDVATLAALADFVSAAIGAVSEISRSIADLIAQRPDLSRPALTDRAVPGMSTDRLTGDRLGEFVANVLRPGIAADVAIKERIEQVLAGSLLAVVCQPIVDIQTGELVGAEALARFPLSPAQPPNVWFDQAEQVGLGVDLQLAAVRAALNLLHELPSDVFLAINVGADAIASPERPPLLNAIDGERVVLELTEHLEIGDYTRLRSVLSCIRSRGIRVAIDDTGAGFASLGHLLNLAPDVIKLDRQFTRGIDLDPVRRALARALVSFAAETGAQVVAEGIETADELETVRRLGIAYGQGYFIGRPAPVVAVPRRFAHAAGQPIVSELGQKGS